MPQHPRFTPTTCSGHDEIITDIADFKPYRYQDDITATPHPKKLAVLERCCGMPSGSKIATSSPGAGGCLILLKGDPGSKDRRLRCSPSKPLTALRAAMLPTRNQSPGSGGESAARPAARRALSAVVDQRGRRYVHARADDIVQNAIVGVFAAAGESERPLFHTNKEIHHR